MITEDYVSLETAKLLKENGFDWNCESKRFYPEPDYDQESPDGVYAPTLQMAMKWLREVHSLHIAVIVTYQHIPRKYEAHIMKLENVDDFILHQNVDFASYEQACEAAIKYCLENLI